MEATPARPTMIFFHAAGSAKWATVKGSVVYGDLRQPEVTVTLGDANGKVKGTRKPTTRAPLPSKRSFWEVLM